MQAYNNALEMKIARLTEENSRLKKQVEEVSYYTSSYFVIINFIGI